MHPSTCPRCGDSFEQDPRPGKHRKFCRPDCGNENNTCAECGAEFYDYPGKRYCSTPCRLKGMSRRNRSDPEAQTARGKLGGAVRGEQMRRPDAYKKTYLRDSGGKHTHRVVAESVLGRPLAPGEVVHHEDQVKHNNHPHNLIVFPSQAAHAAHHKLGHCMKPCDCTCIRLKAVMPYDAS